MEVKYHQINVADLKNEFEYLEYMQQEEYCIIGIEISNPDVAIHCFLNIDPQHERNSLLNNMTALEYVYKCECHVEIREKGILNLTNLGESLLKLCIRLNFIIFKCDVFRH